MAKTTVALDNEIVQSLLQGDLTFLQSVFKIRIKKPEEILLTNRTWQLLHWPLSRFHGFV